MKILLDRWSSSKWASKYPLNHYAMFNPSINLPFADPNTVVSFIPMESVEGKTGVIRLQEESYENVSKGYTQFQNNDILWAKITPCMQNGKSAIAKKLLNGVGFGSTEFHVIRSKNKELSTGYLWELLTRDEFLYACQGVYTGSAGQQRVPQDFLENIHIPIPPIKTQERILSIIQSQRKNYIEKVEQSNSQNSDLYDFILDIIGIKQIVEPRKIFSIKSNQLVTAFNPERYRGVQIEKQLLYKSKIGDACSIVESRIVPSVVGENEKWDWIRIDDLPNQPWDVGELRTELGNNMQGNFFEVQENDILLARLGPTIQNAKFVLCPKLQRRTLCSPEFLVLRCKHGWNPNAVLWILRTKIFREMMYSRSRGGTPSRYRLDGDDLIEIPFPQIDLNIQNKISSEVERRKKEAKRLRSEAELEWNNAKKWFEEQLLGKN